MILPLIEFSSKQFTMSEDGVTLIAEASDLDNRHLQQIYNDACDVGFAVRSERTGAIVVYCMSSVIMNHAGTNDEEIGGWNYEPTTESIRKYPACAGTKAVVFND